MAQNDSLGIAMAIVNKFFPLLGTNLDQAMMFYDNSASLFFEGNQMNGKEQILQFFHSLPSMTFAVDGYEVQTVPGTSLWTMVVIFGKLLIQDKGGSFHSTLFVEASTQNKVARITYHSLTIN